MISTFLDFSRGLAIDAFSAGKGTNGITGRGSFNSVFFSGLGPQKENGDARQNTAQKTAQNATLVEIVAITANQIARAKSATAA